MPEQNQTLVFNYDGPDTAAGDAPAGAVEPQAGDASPATIQTESTTQEPAQPTQGGPPGAPVDLAVEAPLLAGKYRTTEDLERAYKELESKVGALPPAGTKEAQKGPQVTPEFLRPYMDEYERTGAFSEPALVAMEKVGLDRRVAQAFIVNAAVAQREARATYQREVVAEVGTEEDYVAARDWAKRALSEADRRDLTAEILSGDLARAKRAARDLRARYERAMAGPGGGQIMGRTNGPSAPGAFRSFEEMVAAMRDPKYKSDPAYAADVMARIERTEVAL